MSQQCSECGRQSPLGEPMLHFIGCEHISQMGHGQAEAQRAYIAITPDAGAREGTE